VSPQAAKKFQLMEYSIIFHFSCNCTLQENYSVTLGVPSDWISKVANAVTFLTWRIIIKICTYIFNVL